ncbi:MAG: hypothetical protein MJA83_09275, partial [Gammaproteobacteria bacterium]|nr:hypothetical protein [Gammaproteobacteria bacterium]
MVSGFLPRKLIHSLPAALLLAALPVGANTAELPFLLHHYRVHVDTEFKSMDVRACFTDTMPEQLAAGSGAAQSYLQHMRATVKGRTVAIQPRGRIVNLPRVPDDLCVEYQVNIDGISAVRRMDVGLRSEQSLLLGINYWLWRPRKLDADSDIEIEFVLPAETTVSAPWHRIADANGKHRFRVGHTPYYWPGVIALGKLHRESLAVPGAVLRVAMMDGIPESKRITATQWISAAALSVTKLYGEFPQPNPQVLIIPVPGGNDASPFAKIARGGGVAAHFLMNMEAAPQEFKDDWVATHELSHMLLPFINRADAWLSEGIASYYQNILRGRSGLLTPLEAWQKLHEGFKRGDRGTRGGTLSDATRRMRSGNNYMRVYWSGAAMALTADVRLREISGGELSLDVALARLRECCLTPDRSWRGEEMMQKLDELTNTSIFSELYEQNIYSRFFPNLRP